MITGDLDLWAKGKYTGRNSLTTDDLDSKGEELSPRSLGG